MPAKPAQTAQDEATKHVGDLLKARSIEIEPGIVLLGGDEPWQVFEYRGKCVGIDTSAVVWIGPSGGQWRRLGECTVSDALRAIEYLIE